MAKKALKVTLWVLFALTCVGLAVAVGFLGLHHHRQQRKDKEGDDTNQPQEHLPDTQPDTITARRVIFVASQAQERWKRRLAVLLAKHCHPGEPLVLPQAWLNEDDTVLPLLLHNVDAHHAPDAADMSEWARRTFDTDHYLEQHLEGHPFAAQLSTCNTNSSMWTEQERVALVVCATPLQTWTVLNDMLQSNRAYDTVHMLFVHPRRPVVNAVLARFAASTWPDTLLKQRCCKRVVKWTQVAWADAGVLVTLATVTAGSLDLWGTSTTVTTLTASQAAHWRSDLGGLPVPLRLARRASPPRLRSSWTKSASFVPLSVLKLQAPLVWSRHKSSTSLPEADVASVALVLVQGGAPTTLFEAVMHAWAYHFAHVEVCSTWARVRPRRVLRRAPDTTQWVLVVAVDTWVDVTRLLRWLSRLDGHSDPRLLCCEGEMPTIRLHSVAALQEQHDTTKWVVTPRFSRAPPHDTIMALALGCVDHPDVQIHLTRRQQGEETE